MKTKLGLLALLLATHLPSSASALTSNPTQAEITCRSNAFPTAAGSELVLKFKDGKPLDAYLYLGKKDPFQTMGWYDAHTALNENRTPVIYLTWNAGVGSEPTPRSMVIYAFEANYRHNQSLFLGTIEWTQEGKIEKHFSLKCD